MENLIVNEENVGNLPIKHFSVSSILEYLKNPYSFFNKYVMLNWDHTTGPALIIGSAFHFGLEQYYILAGMAHRKETTEFEGQAIEIETPTEEQILKIMLEHLNNAIEENRRKWIEAYIKQKLPEDALVEFDMLENQEGFEEFPAEEKWEIQKTFLLEKGCEEKEVMEARESFIKWWKSHTPATANAMVELLCTNYFTETPYAPSEVLHVEANETAQICNLDGEVLPMPVKWKMDLIIRDSEGKICVIDHKTAAKFVDSPDKAQYELQASAYFFLAWAICGERPSKMIFDEVIKWKQKIGEGLIGKDLTAIAEKNEAFCGKYPNFQKNFNVAELRDIMYKEGLIEASPVINRVVVDFEANPEIINVFLKIYYNVLNILGIMSLYDLPIDFLPNPFADYSGEETWKLFKETVDTTKTWKDMLKETAENNVEQIDDFDL